MYSCSAVSKGQCFLIYPSSAFGYYSLSNSPSKIIPKPWEGKDVRQISHLELNILRSFISTSQQQFVFLFFASLSLRLCNTKKIYLGLECHIHRDAGSLSAPGQNGPWIDGQYKFLFSLSLWTFPQTLPQKSVSWRSMQDGWGSNIGFWSSEKVKIKECLQTWPFLLHCGRQWPVLGYGGGILTWLWVAWSVSSSHQHIITDGTVTSVRTSG